MERSSKRKGTVNRRNAEGLATFETEGFGTNSVNLSRFKIKRSTINWKKY